MLNLTVSMNRFLLNADVFFSTETSGAQRSDSVQPGRKRLVYQPLWRAQVVPCVVDVRKLCPGLARLHFDLSRVTDHNVS